MKASPREFTQLLAYIRASRELNSWINGARIFALLSGAADSGVLDALHTGSTVEQISISTHIDSQSISDLCMAFEAHGIVARDGECYELTPNLARLASADAAVPLTKVIRQARVMTDSLQRIPSSESSYTSLSSEEVLAMAEGAGISSLSSSPHVSQESTGEMLPEVEALWLTGAHHLEVGCGVGNALLGIAATYPKVTAVGIEIDETTATEAKRRAAQLGVTDRVEVRCMDACELQEEKVYDTIQWSQFFFPTPSRSIVLRAMLRSLKPDGYLFMPWFGSPSDDSSKRRGEMFRMAMRAAESGRFSFMSFLNDILGDTPTRRKKERRFAALLRLLFHRWGVPVRSTDELMSEIENSGFRVLRTLYTPVNQFVHTRGFLLAQRFGIEQHNPE